MAVAATRVDVTSTATSVASVTAGETIEAADYKARRYLIKNKTGTASVFIGGSGLTTGNGFEWEVGDGALTVDLEAGETLYAIVATGTQTLHVLQVGR